MRAREITLTPSIEARFWKYVDRRSDVECWEWIGSKTRWGYGQLNIENRPFRTHRLSYLIHCGPFPMELEVMHACDNPACVNPHHLSTGTRSDNASDAVRKGRARGLLGRGINNPNTKLTPEDVISIRASIRNGLSYRLTGIQHGVAKSTVKAIADGKSWSYLTEKSA